MALETGRIKAESGDGANGAESTGAEANWPEKAKFQPRRAKPCDASIYLDRLGEREADRTLA